MTLLYLATIPFSYRRFDQKLSEAAVHTPAGPEALALPDEASIRDLPANGTKH